jgi:hypothetical protein
MILCIVLIETEPGVISKLDYEKAYDRVNLDFFFEFLEARGFGSKCIMWIMQLVVGGYVGITSNGEDRIFQDN